MAAWVHTRQSRVRSPGLSEARVWSQQAHQESGMETSTGALQGEKKEASGGSFGWGGGREEGGKGNGSSVPDTPEARPQCGPGQGSWGSQKASHEGDISPGEPHSAPQTQAQTPGRRTGSGPMPVHLVKRSSAAMCSYSFWVARCRRLVLWWHSYKLRMAAGAWQECNQAARSMGGSAAHSLKRSHPTCLPGRLCRAPSLPRASPVGTGRWTSWR